MQLFCPQTSTQPDQTVSAASKSLYALEEKQTDINLAIPRPQDKQSVAEPTLFNMTFSALTFTDRAIH